MNKENQERHYSVGSSTISVGRFTYGIENLYIREWGEGANLEIGSFCSLATSIQIFLGGNHRTDWITTYPFGHIHIQDFPVSEITGHPSTKGNVKIGHDVWIGHGTTILSGVTIGTGAVVAANSTVTKNIPPYSICGGNPAKIIRLRFSKDVIAKLIELAWWDLPQEQIVKICKFLCSYPNEITLEKILKQVSNNR